MRALAVLAGTSVNTVSLALRDSPLVASATKKRIQGLAALHGYRINPLVAAFVASKGRPPARQTLAVLTKFSDPFFLNPASKNFFCRELLTGMLAEAEKLGFKLEEFSAYHHPVTGGARLTEILRARGIRGVILFPSGDMGMDYPILDWSHFAVVAAGCHMKSLRVHRVATDITRAMDICLDEMQARGYRRIGLALNRTLDPRLRYEGSGRFLAWREQQPAPDRVPLIEETGESHPTNERLRQWIEECRPEAIITHDHYMPAGVTAHNLAHRATVAVAHLGLPAGIACAGVDLRIAEVGQTTVSLLARELYLNHCGLPTVPSLNLVEGVWREGPHIRPRLGTRSAHERSSCAF